MYGTVMAPSGATATVTVPAMDSGLITLTSSTSSTPTSYCGPCGAATAGAAPIGPGSMGPKLSSCALTGMAEAQTSAASQTLMRVIIFPLFGPDAEQHRRDSLGQDPQVPPHGPVIDVVQIQARPFVEVGD